MQVRNVIHKGLRRFLEKNDASGLNPSAAEKIRNIVSFLLSVNDEKELTKLPSWRLHKLSGDKKGVWSLTVTPNWRLTFRIDGVKKEIYDLDYQDYH